MCAELHVRYPHRLLFSNIPLTENMLSHGTDDELAVRYCRAAVARVSEYNGTSAHYRLFSAMKNG